VTEALGESMVMRLIKLPIVTVLMVWMIRYPCTSLTVQTIPNDLMKSANNTTFRKDDLTKRGCTQFQLDVVCMFYGAILDSSPNVPRLRKTVRRQSLLGSGVSAPLHFITK
jgi:hypothetical protein